MIAAVFTPPLDTHGDINYSVIRKYAQHIKDSGISGVFVCGTTGGEFTSLTTAERKLILEEWIKRGEGDFQIIAHVGSDNQREAMELARHAAVKGADGIGCIASSFFQA